MPTLVLYAFSPAFSTEWIDARLSFLSCCCCDEWVLEDLESEPSLVEPDPLNQLLAPWKKVDHPLREPEPSGLLVVAAGAVVDMDGDDDDVLDME